MDMFNPSVVSYLGYPTLLSMLRPCEQSNQIKITKFHLSLDNQYVECPVFVWFYIMRLCKGRKMYALHDSFFGGDGDEINETRFNLHNHYYVALHCIDKCVDLLATETLLKCFIIYIIYNSGCGRRVRRTIALFSIGFFSFLSLIRSNFCIGIKMIEHNIWFLKCSSFHSMVTQEINRDFVGDRVQWCHLIHVASWPHLVKKCFGGGGDSRYFGEWFKIS